MQQKNITEDLIHRLNELRTESRTNTDKKQQEIRAIETKLVKIFAQQLIEKSTLAKHYPHHGISTGADLKNWLEVIGNDHALIQERLFSCVTQILTFMFSCKTKIHWHCFNFRFK